MRHVFPAATLLLFAACAPRRPSDEAAPPPYQNPTMQEPAPAAGPDANTPGQPVVRHQRTGREFQPHRGTKVGDAFLNGKLVAKRVTDESALGVLHGTIQIESKTGEPVLAEYRFLFFDDQDKPVGPVFSTWSPVAVAEPYGAATIHGACSQRNAVYFKLEVKD